MRCGACGSEVKPGLTVCPVCGANIRRFNWMIGRSLHCRACQARVPSGLNICPQCGAPLRRSWRPFVLAVLMIALSAALLYLGLNYVPWDTLRAWPKRLEVPSVAFLATRTFTPMPTPTATRTATPTATPTPSFTPTSVPPTETPPPTARPTATALPAPSSTATPPFVAPRLVTPEDQAEFKGGGTRVELRWEPAGVLNDDEWYALSLRYLTDGVVQYSGTWTKETSWIVPETLYMMAGQAERAFQWDVTVVQQTGTKPDGGREGVALGPTSEIRTFFWY
jgi:RNA polymerase subunit RPABC4/transcription elongation factor Spt4